jgi:hypothetical protein
MLDGCSVYVLSRATAHPSSCPSPFCELRLWFSRNSSNECQTAARAPLHIGSYPYVSTNYVRTIFPKDILAPDLERVYVRSPPLWCKICLVDLKCNLVISQKQSRPPWKNTGLEIGFVAARDCILLILNGFSIIFLARDLSRGKYWVACCCSSYSNVTSAAIKDSNFIGAGHNFCSVGRLPLK